MKQVEAVISRERLPEVDRNLRTMGVSGLSVIESDGKATQTDLVSLGGQLMFARQFLQRLKISLVVEDGDVREVVEAISRGAHRGFAEDGKICVTPVEKAIDIATGEVNNELALDFWRREMVPQWTFSQP